LADAKRLLYNTVLLDFEQMFTTVNRPLERIYVGTMYCLTGEASPDFAAQVVIYCISRAGLDKLLIDSLAYTTKQTNFVANYEPTKFRQYLFKFLFESADNR